MEVQAKSIIGKIRQIFLPKDLHCEAMQEPAGALTLKDSPHGHSPQHTQSHWNSAPIIIRTPLREGRARSGKSRD